MMSSVNMCLCLVFLFWSLARHLSIAGCPSSDCSCPSTWFGDVGKLKLNAHEICENPLCNFLDG